MRFKRPRVRYSETPEPITPYQAAGQVWDERIGSARVQAKNWRLMAFGSLSLALLMAGGLVWRSARSAATPYVLEADAGRTRCGPRARRPRRTGRRIAQIAFRLARPISWWCARWPSPPSVGRRSRAGRAATIGRPWSPRCSTTTRV